MKLTNCLILIARLTQYHKIYSVTKEIKGYVSATSTRIDIVGLLSTADADKCCSEIVKNYY